MVVAFTPRRKAVHTSIRHLQEADTMLTTNTFERRIQRLLTDAFGNL